jgi:hypothetical protein
MISTRDVSSCFLKRREKEAHCLLVNGTRVLIRGTGAGLNSFCGRLGE